MSMAAGAGDLATFGFRVDTSGLAAGDAYLAKLAKTAESTASVLDRFEKTSARAFAAAKVPAGMAGMAGPSPMGGSSATAGIAAHTTATNASTASIHAQNAALHEGAKAHAAHGAASYANRLQMMELGHVGRALFDEMAAGGNIFRALAMEGGRLQLALSSGEGGITGLLGRIGGGFKAIISPAVLAAGAIGAVSIAAAAAAISYENSQERMQRAVEGTGRASGLTANQLRAIASNGAAAGNMGLGESRGIAAGFAQAGLPGDMTAALLNATPRFARFTDQDNATAGAALAGNFRDPVSGAKELDKSLGFLNDRLMQTIEDLKVSGDVEGARRVEMQAFGDALKATTDSTWAVGDVFRELKRWSGSLLEGLGQGVGHVLGSDQSPEDQIAGYRRMLPNTFDSPLAVGNLSRSYVKDQIDRLQHQIDAKVDPGAAAREAQANDLSKQAGPVVRALLPEIVRAQSEANNLSLLGKVLSDPAALAAMSLPRSQVVQAYGREAVMHDMARPGLRQRQDYDLRMAAIDDSGTQDQGLNAARKAELAVLRETGDVIRAATAAQQSYNETIAKANSDAEERLRQAQLDSKLVGLSPYERSMQQLKNEYEGPRGILERDRVDSTSVLDDKDIKRDLTDASKWTSSVSSFTTALDGASQRLAAFPGAASGPFGAGPRPMADAPYTGPVGAVSNHQRQMAQMLVEAGYPQAGAIGFVGGLTGESGAGLNPMARNASNHRGIAQWDSARYGAMAATGDPNDFATQARFIIKELGGPESIAAAHLRAATTVRGGLAANFSYERPSNAEIASSYGSRLAAGNALAGTYGASPAGVDHSTMTVHASSAAFAAPALAGPAPIASTAYGFDKSTYAQKQADVTKSFGDVPIDQANKLLTAQSALLATNRDSFWQSAAATKGAAEAQALWNRLAMDGIVPVGQLSKATGGLSDKVREYGSAAAKQNQEAEDQARLQRSAIDTADTLRGGFDGVLSGGLLSAAHGKGFGAGASSALSGFGDTLLHKGMSGLTGSLFGGQGSGFGGLLGGLFSGLPHFAGGTSDAPGGPTVVGENGPELVQMPQHASVMSNGAVQGLMASKAPNVNVGGHSIVVQGNADDKSLAVMDQKLAAASEQQWQRIVRDLPQISRDSGQYSG